VERDAPKVVKIHDVNIDQEYVQWLGEIKARYRSAQVKASIKVNAEQLIFKWYMKQLYQFYSTAFPKLQQLAGELQIPDNQDGKKLQQLVGEIQQFGESNEQGMDLPGLFLCVPWGHHIQILSKCKNIDEALFYIVRTASEGWSRNTLMNCMEAELHKEKTE